MFFTESYKYCTPNVSTSTSIQAREPRTPFHPPLRPAQQAQGMISTPRQVSWVGKEVSTPPVPHLHWEDLCPVMYPSTRTVLEYNTQENQQCPLTVIECAMHYAVLAYSTIPSRFSRARFFLLSLFCPATIRVQPTWIFLLLLSSNLVASQ